MTGQCMVCKRVVRRDDSRFCSISCEHKHISKKVFKTCEQCKLEFEAWCNRKDQRFCTRQCRTKYENLNPKPKKGPYKRDHDLNRRLMDKKYYDELPSYIHKRFKIVRG